MKRVMVFASRVALAFIILWCLISCASQVKPQVVRPKKDLCIPNAIPGKPCLEIAWQDELVAGAALK